MINRWIEKDLLKTLKKLRIGCIVFSPLAQGMLSEKYINLIPKNSRAAENSSLDKKMITQKYLKKIVGLSAIARKRNQTVSQMALSWTLRHKEITSTLIGSRSVIPSDQATIEPAPDPLPGPTGISLLFAQLTTSATIK